MVDVVNDGSGPAWGRLWPMLCFLPSFGSIVRPRCCRVGFEYCLVRCTEKVGGGVSCLIQMTERESLVRRLWLRHQANTSLSAAQAAKVVIAMPVDVLSI